MAPGFIASGGTSPGITSSSPVENSATRGRRATCSWSQADAGGQAQRRRAPSRSPRASTTAPRVTSSPLRRIHWPGAGTRRMRTRPLVQRPRVSSCITIASAPAGTGAPVKMRAAVPGCQRLRRAAGRDALADRQRARLRRRSRRCAPHSRPWSCCPAAAPAAPRPGPAASTRPSASKVETRLGAGQRLRVRQQLGQRVVQAAQRRAGRRSCVHLRVVVEAVAIVDQPLRHGIGVVQVQHRPQGGLRQARPARRWRWRR